MAHRRIRQAAVAGSGEGDRESGKKALRGRAVVGAEVSVRSPFEDMVMRMRTGEGWVLEE